MRQRRLVDTHGWPAFCRGISFDKLGQFEQVTPVQHTLFIPR